MLDALRNSAKSWVAKLLLIVLVLSFGVWGISGTVFQGAGDTVVKVGDTEVSAADYRFAYNRQISLISRQLGTALTPDQARAFGVEAQALSVVATSATLDEQSRRMNLGLSEDRLASIIEEDPAFQGVNGRFDRARFTQVLYNSNINEDQFITIQQDAAVRTQIIDAIVDGYEAPSTLFDAFNRYQNETRTIDYLVLGRDLVTDIADPSDDELKTYFEANKDRYRAPEYRKITYVTLRASDISDPQSVSAQVARDEYARTIDRYTTPEQRTIEQLTFKTREEADAAAEELAQGKNFEQLVADAGRTMEDVTLGTMTRQALPDPAIAEAAFAVPVAGGTTGVVDGTFAPVIIRVSTIIPASVRSFEEVETEIRQEMAMVEAGNVLLDVHDAYEDARAGGATLEEAATKQRMTPVVIEAVDRTGRTPADELVDIPESAALLQQAFDSDVNIDSPPINIGSEGFLWYEVDDITPERERTLEEVRDRVAADWKREQTDAELAGIADGFRKRIQDGEELSAIATELGLAPDTKYDVKRSGQDAVFGEAAIEAAFSGPNGHVAVADDPGQSAKILLKVTDVVTPTASDAQDLPPGAAAAISDAMANDVLGQAVRLMQDEFGVSVNQRLAETVVSQAY